MTTPVLQAPFPWFGGKSRVAPIVWQALGNVPNYVEPFMGSLAVPLARPHLPGIETFNDKDGLLCNFWRAVVADPDAVAHYADWPIHECDLHARHIWLVQRMDELTRRLEGDMDYYDAKVAGLWLWGICIWIGRGWCIGEGPWQSVDGELVKLEAKDQGINRQLPHLGNKGQGIKRQRPHLGNKGQGIWRQRPHLEDKGKGINRKHADITSWMQALSERLSQSRICCGDWLRILGPSPTTKLGLSGVFLDPPYGEALRDKVYRTETVGVAEAVGEWAIANGNHPEMRIVLAGYHGEHEMPSDWRSIEWKAGGGYGSQGNARGRENATKERLWISPHCLDVDAARQMTLFWP